MLYKIGIFFYKIQIYLKSGLLWYWIFNVKFFHVLSKTTFVCAQVNLISWLSELQSEIIRFRTIFTRQLHENKEWKTVALFLYDNICYIFYNYENKLPIDEISIAKLISTSDRNKILHVANHFSCYFTCRLT